MLKVVQGDLLKAEADALVNTVNTEGVMGKGIALQFKNAFPEMFKAYERACKEGQVRVGHVHVFDQGALFKPRFIINFPTKRHWKENSKVEYISEGLQSLVDEIRARRIKSIAVPPLGCGHGNLNWDVVLPLIREKLEPLTDVDVLVFEPKGAPAPETMVHRTARPELTPQRAGVLRLLADYCILGYDLSLLEIHKLLYFFQLAGEPLKLRFQKDTYGPYADNLRHVMNKFEGHFLDGYGDGRNKPETPIRLRADVVATARELTDKADEVQRGRLARVLQLIEGFESPYGMELLASVHWAATENGSSSQADIVRAVHAWNGRKARIMKPEHIELALQRLADAGWLTSNPA